MQLMGTVGLWDYLLLRMEGEVFGGMQEGGLGAHVVWSLDMVHGDFNKVQ